MLMACGVVADRVSTHGYVDEYDGEDWYVLWPLSTPGFN